MRVIWHEIKKIWNIKMLVVVVVICAIYFFGADVGATLRSMHGAATDEVYSEITGRYGTVLTDEELEAVIREFGKTHSEWDTAAWQIERIISREYFEWERQLYMDAIQGGDVFALTSRMREPLIAEADALIRGNPVFTELGILSYDDYKSYITVLHEHLEQIILSDDAENWGNIEAVRTSSHVWQTFFGPDSEFLGLKLDFLYFIEFLAEEYGDEIVASLQERLERLNSLELTERQRQRLIDVLDNGEYRGTMHGDIFWGFSDYMRHLSFILIMASLVLHSTLVTTDRMRIIQPLQYHSKLGRRIMLRQLWATLLSSLMLATVILVASGIAFAWAGVFTYLHHGLTSFLYSFGPGSIAVSFFPMTFGRYILVLAAVCYALCLGTAVISFVLSRLSRNLVTLTFKIIPVFIVLQRLHDLVLPNRWMTRHIENFSAPLTLWNDLYLRTGYAYLDMAIIAAFTVIAIAVAVIIAKREKRLELLG